ncbi:MAG: universal stress protein [Deltaproteobacteria bacterium]|nr:universal stress protein [Deltaproteobacteria bacterium]
MYQKIMVPLDGSELAECVLPHVATLAEGSQIRTIVFVRVVEPFHRPTGDYVINEEQAQKIEAEHMRVAETYLKKLVERLNYKAVNIQSRILFGRVADNLAEFAEKNEIDLIIIATHGRSGVSRWVFGSVADRILRSSCVPILMVRAPGCVQGI